MPQISNLVRLSLLGIACLSLLLFACGGDDEGSKDQEMVSVQLDWTPNTNHIGIYVALANGWYKDAGINVEVLPYTDAGNADTIVANGQADFGFSFPASLIFSRAAGLDLVSTASVFQTNVTELAVLESSPIQRPRDFDGRTYAGFGLPFEEPQIKTVIKADGGRGDFDSAILSTSAYEALYNRQADFTEIFTAWQGIEAEMRGIELRTFRYDDFGVPDFPGVVLVAKQDKLQQRQDVYERFLSVTRRGYEFAAKNPGEASSIFIDYLPDGTFPEPELIERSTRQLAEAFIDADGQWGSNNGAKWDSYVDWMLKQDIVLDQQDRVLKSLPGGAIYSNELFQTGAKAE